MSLRKHIKIMSTEKINIPTEKIIEFCQKWKINEFALFGSILSGQFQPDSDVDIMVTFSEDNKWSLYDWVDMIEELKGIFGREVDLVEKSEIKNPFRRNAILSSTKVIYAS